MCGKKKKCKFLIFEFLKHCCFRDFSGFKEYNEKKFTFFLNVTLPPIELIITSPIMLPKLSYSRNVIFPP